MTAFLNPIGGPYGGLFPGRTVVKARSDSAVTKGDHVMFDLANAETGLTLVPGSDDSIYYRVRDPEAASGSVQTLNGYIFGIALQTMADGDTGDVLLRGIVNANVEAATVAGSCLVPATDGRLDVATGGTNLKIIAISTAADTSNFADVWFNGVEGFGCDVGSNVST